MNYIYSQTYNFVYLRAKSILKNEEDIKLFMQTVYVDLYRSADEIQLDNLYEWLGKHVYRIGCEHFKKRKEREAAFVEMEEEELNPKQKQHLNENVDVISKSLEQLPDLYQATLFAFYFDYLKMDEIADLMDCSVGVIINRLNYTRKYFKKAIENAWEERGESTERCDTFSVEAVCLALRKWGVEHCLGITLSLIHIYKAFTEEHTTLFGDGEHSTGLDYLKELGVTHVQLMPVYDYGSVDESNDEEFNWGYDPENYNVPEGSYATDTEDGAVRIREFKEMVQSLHKNGFRVIMDVVYNHMYSLESNLNKAVPWYYFRTKDDGTISNGSACGNDVASERPMCANYIVDSVLYWAEEYHLSLIHI